jgi:GcrA cell cycle regulator
MGASFPNFRNYSNYDYQKSSLTLISEYQKLVPRVGRRWEAQVQIMESADWAPEHSDALREHLARGMSFSEIAKAINAKFRTSYSRNAAIGRARRMGLAGSKRPKMPPRARLPQPGKLRELRSAESRSPESRSPMPAVATPNPVKLRCVEVEPRHLALVELERGDCRYPYGGDIEGEAITFCGHPEQPGSSYCTPHFHLSRNPTARSERAENPIRSGWRRPEAHSCVDHGRQDEAAATPSSRWALAWLIG